MRKTLVLLHGVHGPKTAIKKKNTGVYDIIDIIDV